MALVDQIIELASDGAHPVADALRKCLILAFELKNEKLKAWTEKELNGYDKNEDDPDYRKVDLHSKGNFSGPFGAWIPERPLPLAVLEKKHREMLVSKLLQPIASYDPGPETASDAQFNWPADLIAHYQGKFIAGYALSQAWQQLPRSQLIGLREEVRNRLLRFALEIREELGHVGNKPSAVSPAKVEAAVVNYIFGGNNVIAGTAADFAQIGNVVIVKGNLGSLSAALTRLDIPQSEIALLETAIEADNNTFGSRTKEWLEVVPVV